MALFALLGQPVGFFYGGTSDELGQLLLGSVSATFHILPLPLGQAELEDFGTAFGLGERRSAHIVVAITKKGGYNCNCINDSESSHPESLAPRPGGVTLGHASTTFTRRTNMADGDIKTKTVDASKDRFLGSTLISFGDEYYVEAGFKCDDLDAGTLLDAAGRLTKSAAAALHVTRMRGEDSNDSPGTLADALDAVQVCLELAVGFRAAAQQLQREKVHG